MGNELREFRTSKNIPAKDIITTVQELYPSFDKSLLSKCESDKYGTTIRRDAMEAIINEFAPEARETIKKRRGGGHLLTCKNFMPVRKRCLQRVATGN